MVSPSPSGFLTKVLYAFLISPVRVTCLTPLILDRITTIIPGDKYKL